MLVLDSALLALKEGLAVLVELEGSDNAVAGVDGDVRLLGVELLTHDLLDIETFAAAVDSVNLTVTALESASDNLDGITLADRNGADRVLVLKVLGQSAGHHVATYAGGGGKVSLATFSALAGYT